MPNYNYGGNTGDARSFPPPWPRTRVTPPPRRPSTTTPPPGLPPYGSQGDEGAGGADGGPDTYGYCCIRETVGSLRGPVTYRCIQTNKGNCSRLNSFPDLQTVFSIYSSLCDCCGKPCAQNGGQGQSDVDTGSGSGSGITFPQDIDPDVFARDRINDAFRENLLNRINYDEPLDICDCEPYLLTIPDPPTIPRRREPPRPPRPPKPPILPPPLVQPPRRWIPPQIGTVVPPFVPPPPVVPPPPPPVIDPDRPPPPPPDETGGGDDTAEGGGEEGGGGGDYGGPGCCLGGVIGRYDRTIIGNLTDVLSGDELGEGCWSMCANQSLPIYRLYGGTNFCSTVSIQICKCFARNNPSSPCYTDNGQVAKPGGTITVKSDFRRIPLPSGYATEEEYYADNT